MVKHKKTTIKSKSTWRVNTTPHQLINNYMQTKDLTGDGIDKTGKIIYIYCDKTNSSKMKFCLLENQNVDKSFEDK